MFMSLDFDRGKPFYPFVMNYLSMYHGVFNLCDIFIYNRTKRLKALGYSLERVLELSEKEQKLRLRIQEIYNKDISYNESILGPLELKSTDNKALELSSDELAEEIANNAAYILKHHGIANAMLIISAYTLSPKNSDETDQLWNFFFHCRNACAHGGKLKFINKGVRLFPAKWGSLEIKLDMEDTNLFADGIEPGLLWPGDPLYLLFDIEQKYFN